MSGAALTLLSVPAGALSAGSLPPGCLGGLVFAAADVPLPPQPPLLGVPATELAAGGPTATLFATTAPVASGHHGAVHYACSDDLLFGVVRIDEAAAPAALEAATRSAYSALFAAIDALAYPQLLRVWNYLPDINLEQDGIERYRRFNAARQDAFQAHARPVTGAVPAACALGTRHGPLCLAFLAARTAMTALENPRQVSAYDYPPEYGAGSPTFSRAGLFSLHGQDMLFISGTAAIVGHRSLHAGDARGQTRETLANLAALVAEGNALLGRPAFSAEALAYTVYVRHADDVDAVRGEVEAALGGGCRAGYVQADVCRADLLVEIEAVGGIPMESLQCA
jgi:enamine deaminase RidA (YjgF/YER057c/UK114 family)